MPEGLCRKWADSLPVGYFFNLRDREVQLEVQRRNVRPRCHTSDKQISDWTISRSPADRPVARTRQVGALGDSTAPSYRTASPLPAAALQLIQLDSVTEDVWAAITLVARCQFARVRIKWLGGDRACGKKKKRQADFGDKIPFQIFKCQLYAVRYWKNKSRWLVEGLHNFKLCPQKSGCDIWLDLCWWKALNLQWLDAQHFTSFASLPSFVFQTLQC